jgi:hypothetical protein
MQINMNKYLLYFSIFLCFLISCNEQKKDAKEPLLNNENAALSILQIDSTLQKVDSMIFVFYNDPLGKDSLRYARFYKQYSTSDTNDINFIKSQLTNPTNVLEKVKPCRSEGKIWCFSKQDILQTIYFSSYSDLCNHIYIIKNGRFYYSNYNQPFMDKLLTLKKLSITP